MNKKILVGLILGIIVCLGIIFDFFDIIISLSLLICIYELIENYMKIKKQLVLVGIGLLVLIISNEIISSKYFNVKQLIFILTVIIISDVFQEFAGKYYGKNKIGWISPNKTYEGYIGGYIGILLIYFIKEYKFIDLNIIYIFGVFGDLFFSYIKRAIDIKDYSNILVSHGGVLDRLDSFIFSIIGYGLYNYKN